MFKIVIKRQIKASFELHLKPLGVDAINVGSDLNCKQILFSNTAQNSKDCGLNQKLGPLVL